MMIQIKDNLRRFKKAGNSLRVKMRIFTQLIKTSTNAPGSGIVLFADEIKSSSLMASHGEKNTKYYTDFLTTFYA